MLYMLMNPGMNILNGVVFNAMDCSMGIFEDGLLIKSICKVAGGLIETTEFIYKQVDGLPKLAKVNVISELPVEPSMFPVVREQLAAMDISNL